VGVCHTLGARLHPHPAAATLPTRGRETLGSRLPYHNRPAQCGAFASAGCHPPPQPPLPLPSREKNLSPAPPAGASVPRLAPRWTGSRANGLRGQDRVEGVAPSLPKFRPAGCPPGRVFPANGGDTAALRKSALPQGEIRPWRHRLPDGGRPRFRGSPRGPPERGGNARSRRRASGPFFADDRSGLLARRRSPS
jgi:hypothetical protein